MLLFKTQCSLSQPQTSHAHGPLAKRLMHMVHLSGNLSYSTKELFVSDMITDHNLDVLCLTETWLKTYDYIILNKPTHQDYCYKHETHPKGKGEVLQQFIAIFSVFLRGRALGVGEKKSIIRCIPILSSTILNRF